MQIARKKLIEALERVERAGRGATIVTLTAADGHAEFEGGGTEVRVHMRTPADTLNGWTASVPAALVRDVARNLSGDALELTLEGAQLVVTGDGLRGAINTSQAPDAPAVVFPEQHRIAVPARDFAAAVQRVAYAAANPNIGHGTVFTGVHLSVTGERVALVATDGYRLARAFVDAQRGVDAASALVPARALVDLARVADSAGDELAQFTIGNEEGMGVLYAEVGAYRTRMTLLDGSYPEWQRVIPQNYECVITAEASDWAEAIKRVGMFGDPSQNRKVLLELAPGAAQVSADGPYGQAQQRLTFEKHTGSALTLAVNSAYLLQALDGMSGQVELSFSGATSPLTISPAEGINVLAMVVPLRTE